MPISTERLDDLSLMPEQRPVLAGLYALNLGLVAFKSTRASTLREALAPLLIQATNAALVK